MQNMSSVFISCTNNGLRVIADEGCKDTRQHDIAVMNGVVSLQIVDNP